MDKLTFILIFINFFQYYLLTEFNGTCILSKKLRGRYFQSGLGEIEIKEDLISTKGICVQQENDYFLFDNREDGCFLCVLMLRRHRNILQYKESTCSPNLRDLRQICSHIHVETPFYTLVREPSTAVKCPLQGGFTFTFFDESHDECGGTSAPSASSSNLPSARPCVGLLKYRLRFAKCSQPIIFSGIDVDLECIASWKDGSENFMYSSINAKSLVSKDEKYRCFNYQHGNNIMHASMSADSTCRGLKSPTEGPYLFKFIKDLSVMTQSLCQFPDWLDDNTYFDLDRKYEIRLDKEAGILSEFRRSSVDSSLLETHEFKCVYGSEEKNDANQFNALVESTHECDSNYRCLRLIRHSPYALTMKKGLSLKNANSQEKCIYQSYESSKLFVLDTATTFSTRCPYPSIYSASVSKCELRSSVGCSSKSVVTVENSCTNLIDELKCITSWRIQSQTVVLTRQDSYVYSCFIIQSESNKIMLLYHDISCNKTRLNALYFSEGQALKQTDACPSLENESRWLDDDNENDDDEDEYEFSSDQNQLQLNSVSGYINIDQIDNPPPTQPAQQTTRSTNIFYSYKNTPPIFTKNTRSPPLFYFHQEASTSCHLSRLFCHQSTFLWLLFKCFWCLTILSGYLFVY